MNFMALIIVLIIIGVIILFIRSHYENKKLRKIISYIRYEIKCPVENSPDFKECQCCNYCPISKTFKVKKCE